MLGEEKSSDIVLIRHAQSTFNEASRDVAGRLGLFGTFPDFAKNEQFRKEVCFCSDHIDAQLSYHGIHQCTDTQQKMSSIDVDAIIVSPQIRALETCRRVFEGKKIPVIVEPDLTEVLRYSCDISIPIKIKETLYPEYNFSKLTEIGDDWYIKTQPPTTQQLIFQQFKEQKAQQPKHQHEIILQMMSKDIIFETPTHFRARINRTKQVLKGYKQKYGKIAVVAHYHVIEFLKAKAFRNDDQLVEYQGIINCYPYFEHSQDLLRIQ